jgi:hypothetical protein
MADRVIIPYKTSVPVELKHPTDVIAVPQDPLDNTDDGATCTFALMNPAKSEILSAAEAGGQTTLSVTNAGVFVAGDLVEIELDDGTTHDGGAITGPRT